MYIRALLFIAIIVGVPTAAEPGQPSITNLPRLRARAAQMCSYMKKRDFAAAYDLASPDARSCLTREAWVNEWKSSGDGKMVTCTIKKVESAVTETKDVKSKCSDARLMPKDAAVVKVKFELRFPDGTNDVVDDWYNGWIYVDDDWYWHDWASPSMD